MSYIRSLEAQYMFFSPEERMRLALAALARDDLAEKSKLFATCPKHAYRSTDVEYTDRMDAVFVLCLIAAADLRATAGKIATFRYVRQKLLKVVTRVVSDTAEEAFSAGADFGFHLAFAVRESGAAAAPDLEEEPASVRPSEAEDCAFAERLQAFQDDARQAQSQMEHMLDSWILPVAQSLVNIYEALGRFTVDKLGLEPLELLDGYLAKEQNEVVPAMLALFGDLEPNEGADEYEKAIDDYWQSRAKRR